MNMRFCMVRHIPKMEAIMDDKNFYDFINEDVGYRFYLLLVRSLYDTLGFL